MYLAFRYTKRQYDKYKRRKAGHQGQAVHADLAGSSSCSPDVSSDADTTALTASRPNTTTHCDGPSPSSAPGDPSKTRTSSNETPEQRAEKKRRRKYRLKIILGLFAPYTLQALDTTIIASALKFIAEDFGQSQYPAQPKSPTPSTSL